MSEYQPQTKTHYSNYHIEIDVDDSWVAHPEGTKEHHLLMLQRLRNLERAAFRHIENHAGITGAYSSEKVCAFCDEPWDGAVDSVGVPCCCGAAVKDYETQTGTKITY